MNQILPTGETITLIHFSHGAPERIACMPNMTEFHATLQHPHYQRTNDPRAVTCPGCKASGTFQGAMGQVESLIRSGARAK